ncbi:MAG: GntR family transcriptional regulator, partial [Mycobacterium sp.]|uniref:FadR/GntR family transcriptional regulator n=1 Tax=Mycobacterium sp. TaxID=1785 RepID=UPI001ECDCF0D
MIVDPPLRNWTLIDPAHEGLPTRIARRVALEIMEMNWPAGAYLGPERELADRYGVSAPTLDQALRILEDDGVVAVKRGRGGGVVVTKPPIGSAARTTAL